MFNLGSYHKTYVVIWYPRGSLDGKHDEFKYDTLETAKEKYDSIPCEDCDHKWVHIDIKRGYRLDREKTQLSYTRPGLRVGPVNVTGSVSGATLIKLGLL